MRQITHSHAFTLALLMAAVIGIGFGLVHISTDTIQAQSGGTLGYGSRVYGTVSEAVPVVAYVFTGSTGDFAAVTVDSWAGTLDVQLDLVAPNGVILASVTQNSRTAETNSAYLSIFLPASGSYLLRISGENDTIGDFLLTLFGRSAATALPLAYGLPLDVLIPTDAQAQYFSFETETCPTTLVITDLSQEQGEAFQFVAKLRDQRGHTVAMLRGSDQQEDWITVAPQSGRYEVEVTSADPAHSGSIRLLVTCAANNPGCNSENTGAAYGMVCTPCPDRDELVPGGGCPDLRLTAEQSPVSATTITVTWDAVSGADGYSVYVTGLISGGGETYLTHADWISGNPLEFTWTLPETGYDGFTFTLHVMIGDDLLCTQQTQVDLSTSDTQVQSPCAIRADREGVAVRVGPGLSRSIFTSLNPGIEYTVIGFAESEDGSLWWELDKTQFTGHEGVISLWVAQADVTAIGDCSQIPQGDIPPIIPDPDGGDDVPGSWLPCGSCDTCGHPASECVTSPEGVCLWDPATCTSDAGGDPDGGGTCYTVTASVDAGQCFGGASAMIDTPPNCEGGLYIPGTTIQAHAVGVDPKCVVHSWTGCGVSGSSASITFVPPGSCIVTAHMGY